MIREHYLANVLGELERLKRLADAARAQISERDHFRTLDADSNSVATLMKHLAGNMRSRWTDFLTSDGEKPDRDRDAEFELAAADTEAALEELWEAGWRQTLDAIAALGWRDLERTVTVRGEPHTVIEALHRQLTHYAYHVGQIVLLARHFAGPGWESPSVPRGESRLREVTRKGEHNRVGEER